MFCFERLVSLEARSPGKTARCTQCSGHIVHIICTQLCDELPCLLCQVCRPFNPQPPNHSYVHCSSLLYIVVGMLQIICKQIYTLATLVIVQNYLHVKPSFTFKGLVFKMAMLCDEKSHLSVLNIVNIVDLKYYKIYDIQMFFY